MIAAAFATIFDVMFGPSCALAVEIKKVAA